VAQLFSLGDTTFMKNTNARRLLPVVSLGAEHLVIGHLMRRNILAYKAPPNNAGYDLICIHPDPIREEQHIVRVQVKSRYQIDCDGQFIIGDKKTSGAFDYLVIAFLNIGYFFNKKPVREEFRDKKPVFYTLPRSWVESHITRSGWSKIRTKGVALDEFKNEAGFEMIAKDLSIDEL
jgi:hypothetical protein